MLVQATATVELDFEQQSKVIVQILKNDFASLKRDVLELSASLNSLKPYEYTDFYNNLKVLESIDGVLSYYMEYHDHKDWRSSNKDVIGLYEETYSVYT